MQEQGCPRHVGGLQPAPKGWQCYRLLLSRGGEKWASHQGEVLRKHGWLQARRSCRHHGPVSNVPASSQLRSPHSSPPPPTWYLPLAPNRSPSLSQVTMGLGFPNAMQVRVTLLPSLASTYCGGVSVNVGGAGDTGHHCHPPGHPQPLWVWGHTGTQGKLLPAHMGHSAHPHSGAATTPKADRAAGTVVSPGTPTERCHIASQPCPLSSPRAPCPPPTPLHINSLLSKHGKTPQCRSKGSFLMKEAGRITARP